MNELFAALRQFLLGLRPWVAIAPWEQALRVRLGKHINLLLPGLHWKFPIIDVVFTQSIRLRVCNFGYGRQTVTTLDGTAVTFGGAVAYSIRDIELLYRTLHHAEDTLQSLARGFLAQFFTGHKLAECAPELVSKMVGAALAKDFESYGLADVSLYLTDFAVVKTFRLIGDNGPYANGLMLETSTPTTRMP